MSDHTPGPWYIGQLASYDGYTGLPYRNVWSGEGDGKGAVVARSICTEGSMVDVDANARLIAAAPDLLESCRKALHLVEENNEEITHMSGSFGLLLCLSKAIAKAEGSHEP